MPTRSARRTPRCAWILDGQRRPPSRRSRRRVARGRARGWQLRSIIPGHISFWPLRRLRPAHLMTSKLRPAISGTPRTREAQQDVPLRQPDRGEDEDGHDHHDQQEARAAAGCRREKRWAFTGVSGSPCLEAGDRLVLGAVVLEHATQVAQAGEQHDVAEEDRGADEPLDEPEQDGRAELVLEQAGEPDGDDEEQADGEQQRDEHGAEPHRARDRLRAPRRAARWPTCRAP